MRALLLLLTATTIVCGTSEPTQATTCYPTEVRKQIGGAVWHIYGCTDRQSLIVFLDEDESVDITLTFDPVNERFDVDDRNADTYTAAASEVRSMTYDALAEWLREALTAMRVSH